MNKKDKKEILETNYKKIKITDKTKEDILKHHRLNYRLPVKVFMGLFYTDDEYNKTRNKAFNATLPGDEKGFQKVKKLFNRKK